MPTRYYIVPFDGDGASEAQPKYTNLFGGGLAQGLIPQETSPQGQGNKTWRQSYFAIKITNVLDSDFDALEAQSDVIRVDTVSPLQKLNALGIDVAGLDDNSPQIDIEKRICGWLINDDSRGF